MNLADLLRASGRDAEGRSLLERALQVDPDSRVTHHALGLLLVRAGRRAAALSHLRTAAAGAPEDPHFAYAYALALHASGDTAQALAVLRENVRRHDGHQDTILALATLYRDTRAWDQAIHHAKRLLALDRLDARGRGLLRELRSRRGTSAARLSAPAVRE